MNNKNIAEILRKVGTKTTNRVVCDECRIWIGRIENNRLEPEIKRESELQKDAMRRISIVYDVHKENIIFDGLSYTYPEIKDIIIVRKFVELLMNK